MRNHGAPNAGGRSVTRQKWVDEDVFKLLVDLEVEKATRLQYCVSVVCLTPDLPNHTADPTLLAPVAMRQLRATDVLATLSRSAIGLLLVDAETHALPRIVSRATEALEGKPVTVGGREARLTWSAGAGCYPQTASNGRDLLRQASDLMARAKEEGGHRLYVAS